MSSQGLFSQRGWLVSHLPVLPSHQSRLYEASATRYGHQEPILSKTSDGCGQAGRYPSFPFDFFFTEFSSGVFNLSPVPTKTYQKEILEPESFESKERTELCTERDCWVSDLTVTEISVG